jgi:hypothetical protein
MGFFDFLKPKQMQVETVMTAPVKNFPSMPTVKPDQEIYACYDEIFLNEIVSVTGVTAQEKTEILKIVKTVGFMDLSAYQERVWNTYFKGRFWAWGEFEEWNSTFEQLGKFPSRFPQRTNFSPDNLDEVLNKLKVGDLKSNSNRRQNKKAGTNSVFEDHNDSLRVAVDSRAGKGCARKVRLRNLFSAYENFKFQSYKFV